MMVMMLAMMKMMMLLMIMMLMLMVMMTPVLILIIMVMLIMTMTIPTPVMIPTMLTMMRVLIMLNRGGEDKDDDDGDDVDEGHDKLKPTTKIHNNAEDDVVHNDNDVYLHVMNHHDEDDAAVRNDSEDRLNCSCRRGAHILVYGCRTAGGGSQKSDGSTRVELYVPPPLGPWTLGHFRIGRAWFWYNMLCSTYVELCTRRWEQDLVGPGPLLRP